MKYRLLLIVLALSSFFVSFGVAVKASNSPYDLPQYSRDYNYGYFRDRQDDWGGDILPRDSSTSGCQGSGTRALPLAINTANEFIDFIKCKLSSNNGNATVRASERVGAAFLIQTMIGSSKTNPPSSSQIQRWEDSVRYAESQGWISWDTDANFRLNSYYQGVGSGSNPNDDAFFRESATRSDDHVIEFRGPSGVRYIIRRLCANPIGTALPLQAPPNFNMTGGTRVSNASPSPGTTITFTHWLRNTGPDGTSPTNINWTARNTLNGAVTDSGNGGTFTNGQAKDPLSGSSEAVNIPASTAPGTQFCRRLSWTPDTASGGSGQGPIVCATVGGTYNLEPTVTVTSGSTTVQQGDTVQFTYEVDNTGVSASPSVNCTVRDGAGNGVSVSPWSCPRVFGPGTPTSIGVENFVVTNEPAGTTICRRLTVAPASPGVPSADSELACVIVAKGPYVHFTGGDVWAGGDFAEPDGTCTTITDAKITTLSKQSVGAGSVVEYAAFALGEISRFGSGSRPLYDSNNFADLGRRLAFANNTTTLGVFGAPQHCMNDYAANYESAPGVGGSVDLNRGSGAWHAAGDLTLFGTLPAGSKQAYLVDGDVTISGDIRYIGGAPTYGSSNDIPSLLIIAKGDIFVDQSVTSLDGVFVSRGTFYTCRQKPMPPTISTCASLLTINGSVIANQLDLYRTRGADGATPDERKLPAEIFNLSPEVFLNNVLNTSNQPTLTTSDIRELPPRF